MTPHRLLLAGLFGGPSLWMPGGAAFGAEPTGEPREIGPDDVQACRDLACLGEVIPRAEPVRFAPKLCDGLAGRRDGGAADGIDLGVLCQMLVARNEASTRAVDPCARNKGPSPDFDPDLGQDWLMWAETRLGYGALDAPEIPDGRSSSRGTRYRSFFRETSFRLTEGELRVGYRYTMMYCIAKAPEPVYVPYFHWLTRDGEVRAAGPVESPLTERPVLAQARGMKGSGRPFLVTQLDGEGEDDLLAVVPADGLGAVRVVACLHRPGAATCDLRESEPIKPRLIGVVEDLVVKQGRPVVEFKLHGHVHASVTLELTEDALAVVSKSGELENP